MRLPPAENQQWPLSTGATHGMIDLGEVMAAYLHPDDQGYTSDAREHAKRTGERFMVKHCIRSFEGGYHWFLASAENAQSSWRRRC